MGDIVLEKAAWISQEKTMCVKSSKKKRRIVFEIIKTNIIKDFNRY